MVYQWAEGARFGGDAQPVGDRLEALRAQFGKLDAPTIVADAKNKKSPLHKHFDWNLHRAAEEHWLYQARVLAACVVHITSMKDGERTVRAFAAMRVEGQTYRDYTPMSVVMSDPAKREALLQQALGEANTWRRRYETLLAVELAPVFEAIDTITIVKGYKAS